VPRGQEMVPCVRLQELLSALAHAHSRGVVHADIKPENIGYRERGRLRVFDFGIALQAAREVEQFHGTPGWAALEAP
jgi:eukaryotic-like serine/threonine-protein kinase